MNTETVKTFFDAWSVYDLVLDRNYMFHEEIYRDVGKVLRERFAERAFSMLDLGCGSARHLAGALKGAGAGRYSGCDISNVALEHARKNLEPVVPQIELREATLLDALAASGAGEFDVVFSSFALHHLSLADKGRFFELALRALAPGGLLLLIDTAVEEHEDRLGSVQAYCDWVKNDWNLIPSEAKTLIYGHILGNDYPEKSSTLLRLAEKAGFAEGRDLNRFRSHRTWSFLKAAST